MIIPIGYDQIRNIYGDPHFRDLGHGQLAVDPKWEDANMHKTPLPGYDRMVYMHNLIVQPTQNALARAITRRPDYKLRVIGCFAPRFKKTIKNGMIVYRSDAPSIHSWGAALDINPDTNTFGASSWDMPDEFVEEFLAEGFVWGGHFKTCDPMHFQLAHGV